MGATIKISKHMMGSGAMRAYLSKDAMELIDATDIIFSEKTLTIKLPVNDEIRTHKVNKNHRHFSFGAKKIDANELVGLYTVELKDNVFTLTKIIIIPE